MLIPCLRVSALGDAAANIRCLCFLEELPGIPGRTIQAGKRGARCQQQRRSQQRQDDAAPVTAVAVGVGKGFA